MFYTKNLSAWERLTRVVAGIVMALCGFIGPGLAGTAVGPVVAAAGGMTLLTGFSAQPAPDHSSASAHSRALGSSSKFAPRQPIPRCTRISANIFPTAKEPRAGRAGSRRCRKRQPRIAGADSRLRLP